MNKLVMGSLLTVFATTFAGCIFVSDDTGNIVCGDGVREGSEVCDDGNNTAGDGCSASCTSEGALVTTTANWSFATIAFNAGGTDTVATPSGCPGGQFDTAAVISQAIDANGVPIGNCDAHSASGTCFIDLYNCTDMTGTEQVPAGDYIQWVSITNADGTQVYADTISTPIDLTANNTITVTILDDGGYFRADWALADTNTNAPLDCAAAGADGISIDSTVAGSSAAVADTFSCDDLGGITGGIPDGNYTLSMQALNANMAALGPATTMNGTIGVQNQITDLGTVTIKVD